MKKLLLIALSLFVLAPQFGAQAGTCRCEKVKGFFGAFIRNKPTEESSKEACKNKCGGNYTYTERKKK